MIMFIHEKLLRWAYWSARGGHVRGLGYARTSLVSVSRSTIAHDPKMDEEAFETHKAVIGLQPKELAEAVNAYYLGRGTREQQAKDCGCSLTTFRRRIDHAHDRLIKAIKTY